MKKLAALVALIGVVSVASAAEKVGELRDVQGNVTVTSEGSVVKAVNGTPLTANSRIVVSSGARASVMLNEGCLIPLRSSQYLALNPKLACTQQVAAVTQLAEPYRLAQAPVGGGVGGGAAAGGATSLLVVGGIVGGLLIINEVEAKDLSGN